MILCATGAACYTPPQPTLGGATLLRDLLWSIARRMGGPLPEYADGSPMPPEEHGETAREYNEEKLRLDAELYWAAVWDEDDDPREDEW